MEAYELEVASEKSGLRHSGDPMMPRKPSPLRVALVFIFIALAFAGLFIYGYYHYRVRQQVVAEAASTAEDLLPDVNVEKVRRAADTADLTLPGNITPVTEAYIYARASGYVRRRLVDIGDRVREGALLAEIEAPELDQQVQQAKAALAQSEKQLDQAKADLGDARAKMELARVTWDRYKVLMEHGAVSRQEGDQQLAAFRSSSATMSSVEARIGSAEQNVNANRANFERLRQLLDYTKVRAPFGGVITARSFDVGALISGSGGSLGQGAATGPGSLSGPSAGAQGGELFRIAQANVVRVLVSVPESSIPGIRPGQSAVVLAQAFPRREFSGRVTRTANAVDVNSRTMLVEIQVRNPDLALMPGMYVQVRLQQFRPSPPLLVPGNSVLATPRGLLIAVLQDLPPQSAKTEAGQPRSYPPQAKRVHLQEIQVGRDYGQEMEVIGGLQGWEYYVLNPGDEIVEGAIVRPLSRPKTQPAGPEGRPGDKGGKAKPQTGPASKEGGH